MNIKISGKVVKILPEYTKNNFTSREFWVLADEDTGYPQTLKLEVTGKSLSMFGSMMEGDYVEADCNLKGKVYNDKCYITISCWKALVKGKQNNNEQKPQQTRQERFNTPPNNAQPASVVPNTDDSPDDLPF